MVSDGLRTKELGALRFVPKSMSQLTSLSGCWRLVQNGYSTTAEESSPIVNSARE